MLEEILKKESVDENDIKVLVANLQFLSYEDKVRFGFIVEEPKTVSVVEEEFPVVEEKPKKISTRRKKVV